MKKMAIAKWIFVSVLFLGILRGAAGYCQDLAREKNIKIVRGSVMEIDWVAEKLVVRTYDFGDADEVTFRVPQATKIVKGVDEISLTDIELSDNVSVEYCDSLSGLIAVNIKVQR